jgi:hypothetical protein
MMKYILILIPSIILSCNSSEGNKIENNSFDNEKEDSISKERKEYAEMVPILDSLWKVITQKRQLLLDKNLMDSHTKEVINDFQDIMYATGALTQIDPDSTKFHAPLNRVNEIVVRRFNNLCESEIKGEYVKMPEFKKELEYFTKNNYYIEMILKNELIYLDEKLKYF